MDTPATSVMCELPQNITEALHRLRSQGETPATVDSDKVKAMVKIVAREKKIVAGQSKAKAKNLPARSQEAEAATPVRSRTPIRDGVGSGVPGGQQPGTGSQEAEAADAANEATSPADEYTEDEGEEESDAGPAAI